MANAIKLRKQPWEVIPVSVDFSENMEEDEIIEVGLSDVVAYNSSSEDVSDSLLKENSISVVDDKKLQISIQNGEDKNNYLISFRAYISDDKKLEEDVKLKVID